MIEYLWKGLKWFFVTCFVIGGFAALVIADELNTIRPVMFGCLSFGAAFLMTLVWTEIRDRILLFSFIIVIITGLIARYAPLYVYIYIGYDLPDWNFYFYWAGLLFFPGVPVMAMVFKKYGD